MTTCATVRSLHALLMTVALACPSFAQTAYVAPAEPMMVQPGWGGYVVPEQVPYQPMMVAPGYVPGAAIDPYQTYPNQSVAVPVGSQPVDIGPASPVEPIYLDGSPPGVASELPPGAPLYPGSVGPSLRDSLTPPDARNGFFQKARASAAILPQFGDENLGWTDIGFDLVTALPFFTRENPIIITPTYDVHFLDRPVGLDLPATLHDIAIDFHVFRVFGNHWIADLAVQPGLYGDSDSLGASEALRFTGRALGVYAPNLELKYALGITYLDGGWAKIVPVAGIMYKPNDDIEYQLVFPTPRISWRLPWTNIPGKDERWAFVSLEFANQAWAFQNDNSDTDVLAYRDYRAIVGFERKIVGGLTRRFELGYVFNRDIKIASVSGNDIGMGSTMLARVGIAY